MESWQELLRKRSVASLEARVARFGAEHFPDLDRLRRAAENFEFRISPAMVELITSPGDPIWRQYVPDSRSSTCTTGSWTRWPKTRTPRCRTSHTAIRTG